jgi:hypothetical protein
LVKAVTALTLAAEYRLQKERKSWPSTWPASINASRLNNGRRSRVVNTALLLAAAMWGAGW